MDRPFRILAKSYKFNQYRGCLRKLRKQERTLQKDPNVNLARPLHRYKETALTI